MQFNWIAENYNKNSQFQYDHAISALDKHTFNGNEYVLDVGCGDGKISSKISTLVPNGLVIGIDSAKSMVEFSRKKFCTQNTNLSFHTCKAEEIYFNNYFDLIVSFACLHWVKDQLSFLINAKKALKNNGKIILTLYPKHKYLWDSIEDTVLHENWKNYFETYSNPHISYDLKSYESFIKKANLHILHLEEHIPIAYFSSPIEAKDFLKSWLPHTDQLDNSLKDIFLTSIIERFCEQVKPLMNGSIRMPFRRLDVVLEK